MRRHGAQTGAGIVLVICALAAAWYLLHAAPVPPSIAGSGHDPALDTAPFVTPDALESVIADRHDRSTLPEAEHPPSQPTNGSIAGISSDQAALIVAVMPADAKLLDLFQSLPPGELREHVSMKLEEMTFADPAPVLSLYLRSQDKFIRRPLGPVLARSADAGVVDGLVIEYRARPNGTERFEIDDIISTISSPAAVERLIFHLEATAGQEGARELRATVARALGTVGTPESVEYLFRQVAEESNARRIEVGLDSGISKINSPSAKPVLLEYLSGQGHGASEKVRWMTLSALSNYPEPDVVSALRGRASVEEGELRTEMLNLAEGLEHEMAVGSP